jgi:hypothetical protein
VSGRYQSTYQKFCKVIDLVYILYKATKYRTFENLQTSGCPSRAAGAASGPSSAVPRAAAPAVAAAVRSYARKFMWTCALACGRAVCTHPRGAGTRVGSLAGRAS